MKFDSVIIGGGLAGLVCGIRLSKAGRRCAIISSGQSALHFSSGSFDLLGALPDGTPVTAPAESVAETIRQAPEHPYARIGAERFGALAAEAAAARNHYRLTPMGGLKPAWLTLAGYVRSEASDALPWRKAVLFNAEGFLDFYTQFLAEGFRRMGTECAVRTFNMPALETIRNNPSEMRSANIARIFDRQENLDELARILRREAGDAEAVLLPAVLGIDRRDAAAQLERQAGRPVAMVATLPPSVPGLQAQLQLRRYFQQSGGVYMLGDTAVRYEAEGGRDGRRARAAVRAGRGLCRRPRRMVRPRPVRGAAVRTLRREVRRAPARPARRACGGEPLRDRRRTGGIQSREGGVRRRCFDAHGAGRRRTDFKRVRL